MIPPINQIRENLYTKGKEFMVKNTYENYVGYYYSISGKYFIGAKFKQANPIELIKYDETKEKTFQQIAQLDPKYAELYPKVLNIIKKDNFEIKKVNPTLFEGPYKRYFIKRKNEINAPVMEVDVTTYSNAQSSLYYYTGEILWDGNNNLNELETQIPGVSDFIRNITAPYFS